MAYKEAVRVSPCWQFHGRALPARYIILIPNRQAALENEAKVPISTGSDVFKGT